MVLATAITKTEEVGWDPNHLILPSQSSYLHQDNLALRSTCYVLDHIGFITCQGVSRLVSIFFAALVIPLRWLKRHRLNLMVNQWVTIIPQIFPKRAPRFLH
ncbi:hypothetical protein Pcinc_000534 [Petrolisthes cinctipes]|uniref:Uncharacterized protein n=1 Tax=Petrolisthes cinctipes TaxID=88211 RepID=A0AAE1L469_PETCI|nr:hypothetical protein Pcinc_000534 [Petrolisthes cinctipes]